MTDTSASRAILTFTGDLGRNIRLSIPRARTNMTQPEATIGMNRLIAADVIQNAHGSPVGIYSMKVETTNRTRVV